jgi:molybdenum cofactor biosynthesis enzyme MoaA
MIMEKVYIVPIEKQCNCNCTFCISKVRDYNKKESIMKLNNQFFDTLQTLKELKVNKVEITGGGEPTIHLDLQRIIDYIRMYLNDCHIKIYTNGREQVPINNVDEINISLASIDDEINRLIMRYKDTKSILEIIRFYSDYTNNLRLSIPIIKGSVDNADKLMDIIEKTKPYVSSYVLRTLYEGTPNMDKEYADFDIFHPLIKMEKDNCLCEFKNRLIMWSDNSLYTNWDLNEEYTKGRCYK